jgi:hypothetical protein
MFSLSVYSILVCESGGLSDPLCPASERGCEGVSVQKLYSSSLTVQLMEQHTLKNVNNCLNTNIYSYLETSGGQSSNLYLNVAHFFFTSVN